MGYYPQFPEVISLPRAGYPRVTEPCAEGPHLAVSLATRMSKPNSNSGGRRQDQPEFIREYIRLSLRNRPRALRGR